jgi:hypothetical protein
LHHKKDYEGDLLKRMGLDLRQPEAGCCGMAGAFGYEPGDHYDVSIQCGERVLLPEVRQAGEEDVLVADGFSCREQIGQDTSRTALHLAQGLELAQKEQRSGARQGRPEGQLVESRQWAQRTLRAWTLAGLLAGVGVGVVWALLKRRGVLER